MKTNKYYHWFYKRWKKKEWKNSEPNPNKARSRLKKENENLQILAPPFSLKMSKFWDREEWSLHLIQVNWPLNQQISSNKERRNSLRMSKTWSVWMIKSQKTRRRRSRRIRINTDPRVSKIKRTESSENSRG